MSKSRSSYWKSHPGSAVLRLLVWLSAVVTVAVMAFLVGFILIKGVGNLRPELFALEYNSENASSLIAFLFPLFIFFLLIIMKKKIVTFIHYQRLREIYHTLIIYKECPKNNNK